ncbi:hypothetical protein R3P38DRAFT_2807910 [Favolaschia claudopus]|uniref:Uncharacterized protein n=1 Tax=Favolaschia claudopus TaxID=2862362 RepID=A0AAV9ZHM7_9AGAR
MAKSTVCKKLPPSSTTRPAARSTLLLRLFLNLSLAFIFGSVSAHFLSTGDAVDLTYYLAYFSALYNIIIAVLALAFALFCLRMYRWRKLSSTTTYVKHGPSIRLRGGASSDDDDSDSPDDQERKRKRKGKQPMRPRKRPSGTTSEPIDLSSDSESELGIRVTAGSKKRKLQDYTLPTSVESL